MKGSHPRAADRCPFVLGHSLSQVTSFMQLGMLWVPVHLGLGVWNQSPLEWCHNMCDGIWNQQHLNCLLNHLFRCRSKKTSTLHVIGLCEGTSTILWHHHVTRATVCSHDSSDYQRMKHQSSTFMVLWEGNTPLSSGFYLQRASTMESILIWWRHHGMEKRYFTWHM